MQLCDYDVFIQMQEGRMDPYLAFLEDQMQSPKFLELLVFFLDHVYLMVEHYFVFWTGNLNKEDLENIWKDKLDNELDKLENEFQKKLRDAVDSCSPDALQLCPYIYGESNPNFIAIKKIDLLSLPNEKMIKRLNDDYCKYIDNLSHEYKVCVDDIKNFDFQHFNIYFQKFLHFYYAINRYKDINGIGGSQEYLINLCRRYREEIEHKEMTLVQQSKQISQVQTQEQKIKEESIEEKEVPEIPTQKEKIKEIPTQEVISNMELKSIDENKGNPLDIDDQKNNESFNSNIKSKNTQDNTAQFSIVSENSNLIRKLEEKFNFQFKRLEDKIILHDAEIINLQSLNKEFQNNFRILHSRKVGKAFLFALKNYFGIIGYFQYEDLIKEILKQYNKKPISGITAKQLKSSASFFFS